MSRIYAAIRVNGIKHVFCTETDVPKDAVNFKNKKKADLELSHEAIAKRGARVQELFDDYIDHLKRRETDRGAFSGVLYRT
jgi:hypothetical protein